MNCQEALKRLYEVIDKEASEIDEAAIREHIDHCRHCRGIYEAEKALSDFIQARLRATTPTTKLDALRSKVVAELDRVDCSSPATASGTAGS